MRFFIVWLACLATSSSVCQAYDIDTHFYECYLMARFVGIRHEVAIKMSQFNEWVDQNYLTTPFDPVPGPGTRKRRLYHFTQEAINRYDNSSKKKNFLGFKLNFLGLSQENNEMASELLSYAFKTGNFMLASAGVHVLMDSFGHSQFTYVLGHIEFGHWPDRPWYYYDKHRRMTETVFDAMVTFRDLLPKSALDPTFGLGNGPRHFQLESPTLFALYDNNPQIQKLIQWDVFKDPKFTRPAVSYILQLAQRRGLLQKDYSVFNLTRNEQLFASGADVRTILKWIFTQTLSLAPKERDRIININYLFKKYLGGLSLNQSEFVNLSPDRLDAMVDRMVYVATMHQIPGEISKEKLVDFESGGPLRHLEMYLRLREWRRLISSLTNQQVAFKKDRFAFERVAAEPKADDDPIDHDIFAWQQQELAQAEVVTPSINERLQWMKAITKYDFLSFAQWVFTFGQKKARADLLRHEAIFGIKTTVYGSY